MSPFQRDIHVTPCVRTTHKYPAAYVSGVHECRWEEKRAEYLCYLSLGCTGMMSGAYSWNTPSSTPSSSWSGVREATGHYFEKYLNYGLMHVAHYIGENPPDKKWVEGPIADFLFNFESTTIGILLMGIVLSYMSCDIIVVAMSIALLTDAYIINYVLKLLFRTAGPQGLNGLYGYQMPYYPSEQIGVLVAFGVFAGIYTKRTGGLYYTFYTALVIAGFFVAPVYRNVAYPDQVLIGFVIGGGVGTFMHCVCVNAFAWLEYNSSVFKQTLKIMGLCNHYSLTASFDGACHKVRPTHDIP